MDISSFIVLFVVGFFIGFMSRIFYAQMSGQLRVKSPERDQKVYYVSPKSDDERQEEPSHLNRKAG